MTNYQCRVCGIYSYDDEKGDGRIDIEADTELNNFPADWRCPVCGAEKGSLQQIDEAQSILALERYQDFLTELSRTNRETLNLNEIRNNSRDKLRGICSVNKVCDGDPKRMCMGQKYGEPIGFGGVGKGLSFTANIEALDKIKLKTRLISEHEEPDMVTEIFGSKLAFPIMASSTSGVKASMGGSITEDEYAYLVLKGSKEAGTIGWIGNTADEDFELSGVKAIKKVGTGIPIFKPQKNEKLMLSIKMAEEVGAAAVGIDLDGAGNINWERKNKLVYRKSESELRELVDSCSIPFIAKGIMSVEDALSAVDAGAAGIDVSNHGGRALDSTRGVAEVLPEIVKEVGGKVTVTAGGGVRTGIDVMKMLALGADGVLIGRDIIRAALGGGVTGVKLQFDYLVSDLRRAMILTSSNKIADINEDLIDNIQ
jgi:isopentenyl diphosphate isomerase/L-lactate dehydrogenase-like FMN-dependent dehydrogenase/rubredoxin